MTSLFKWKLRTLQQELVKAENLHAPLSRRTKEEVSPWPFAAKHFLPHNLRPSSHLQTHRKLQRGNN